MLESAFVVFEEALSDFVSFDRRSKTAAVVVVAEVKDDIFTMTGD